MQDDFLGNEDTPKNGNAEKNDDFSLESILKEYSDKGSEEPKTPDEQDKTVNAPLENRDDMGADELRLPNKHTGEPIQRRQAVRKKSAKKNKGRGCFMSMAWIISIAAVSIILASSVLIISCELLGIGKEQLNGSETVQIYIPEGTPVKSIATILKDEDIILSKYFFLAYLKLKDKGTAFNYGYHDLAQNMGYQQIIEVLEESAKAEDLEVQIPEGSSIDKIAALMEEKEVCTAADFRYAALNGKYQSELLDAVPDDSRIYFRLEGYLFPDTYRFFKGDDPERVIQKMLDNTESKFTREMRQDAAEKGYSTHQIIAMASVIELESCGYFDEMPSVSAVFWNRMNNWGVGGRFLQSDVTMNYPYGSGSYDTYKNEGLPPGPLCNVTGQAIKAAVYPREDFDYYYFVTDANFKFYYNRTNSEHESTIASLKRKGLWLS